MAEKHFLGSDFREHVKDPGYSARNAGQTRTQPLRTNFKKKLVAYIEQLIVQELCESRGGRPGLSVPTSLLVSLDVKNY